MVSVNRHGRFRDSDLLRKVFEEVVCSCMAAGLVGGEGFAVDASELLSKVVYGLIMRRRDPGVLHLRI